MSAAKNLVTLQKIRKEVESAQGSIDYFWNPETKEFDGADTCANELMESLDRINKMVAKALGEEPIFVGFRETDE